MNLAASSIDIFSLARCCSQSALAVSDLCRLRRYSSSLVMKSLIYSYSSSALCFISMILSFCASKSSCSLCILDSRSLVSNCISACFQTRCFLIVSETNSSVWIYFWSFSIVSYSSDSTFLYRRSWHDCAPSIYLSMYQMCSLASTSVSLTVFFFSRISLLSSNCCFAASSLALRSVSVTCLILMFKSFSTARKISNSCYLVKPTVIQLLKLSNFKNYCISAATSLEKSMRSFLCFLISRWLPSTSGLSYSCLHSFLVDSLRSFATF